MKNVLYAMVLGSLFVSPYSSFPKTPKNINTSVINSDEIKNVIRKNKYIPRGYENYWKYKHNCENETIDKQPYVNCAFYKDDSNFPIVREIYFPSISDSSIIQNTPMVYIFMKKNKIHGKLIDNFMGVKTPDGLNGNEWRSNFSPWDKHFKIEDKGFKKKKKKGGKYKSKLICYQDNIKQSHLPYPN